MTRPAKLILTAAALIGGLAATPAMADGNDVSSPYIVGAWKFETDSSGAPKVDTEFRFINPTSLHLILEYAFFDSNGAFCGCDRDDFPPNKTTIYTMFQELNTTSPIGKPVFTCTTNPPTQGSGTPTNGAVKSIVFLSKGNGIKLDDALQVGFQTHAFKVDPATDPAMAAGVNLQGAVMTEAGMQAISINKATKEDIEMIHQGCVTVNGN